MRESPTGQDAIIAILGADNVTMESRSFHGVSSQHRPTVSYRLSAACEGRREVIKL